MSFSASCSASAFVPCPQPRLLTAQHLCQAPASSWAILLTLRHSLLLFHRALRLKTHILPRTCKAPVLSPSYLSDFVPCSFPSGAFCSDQNGPLEEPARKDSFLPQDLYTCCCLCLERFLPKLSPWINPSCPTQLLQTTFFMSTLPDTV